MEKVNINLLPTEVSQEQAKQEQFTKVQYISIGVILLILLCTSVTVALRFVQSQQIKKLQAQSESLKQRVESYKKREIALTLIKNRVNSISQLLSKPAKQTAIFNFVTEKLPSAVVISSVTVDRNSDVLISMIIPNSGVLKETLDNLTSDESFKKIAKIQLESLSSSRDGIFRLNMRVVNK